MCLVTGVPMSSATRQKASAVAPNTLVSTHLPTWPKIVRLHPSAAWHCISKRLGKPPSYVAKYEGGDRRLDVLELVDVAEAIGFDPCKLIRALRSE
jgi:hypothetical protein